MQPRSVKDWVLPSQENEATKEYCVELERGCVTTSRILSGVMHELIWSAKVAYVTHRVEFVELMSFVSFSGCQDECISTWLKLANMTTSLCIISNLHANGR